MNEDINSYLEHVTDLKLSLPTIFPQKSWGKDPLGKATLILQPGRNPSSLDSYYLTVKNAKYFPLVEALGLRKSSKWNAQFSFLKPQQLTAFAAVATSVAYDAIIANFPEIAAQFISTYKERTLPSGPQIQFSNNEFVFVGSLENSAWASNTGWQFDLLNDVYKTRDPLQAAALMRHCNTSAKNEIAFSHVPEHLQKQFERNPVGWPWLAIDKSQKVFALYANANHSTPVKFGFENSSVSDNLETRDIKIAAEFKTLAPDRETAKLFARISNSSSLVDIDGLGLSDIFSIIESEQEGGNRNKSEQEEHQALDYVKQTGKWITGNHHAIQMGFHRRYDGRYETANFNDALKLRDKATIRAEARFQSTLALQMAEARKSLPDLVPPAPPNGFQYSPEQIEGIQFALAFDKSMNGDEPGFGKTVQACGIISILRPARTLIVTLANNLRSFYRHVQGWVPDAPETVIARSKTIPKDGITIISDTSLARAKAILNAEWDLVIIDESQKFKNETSDRSAAVDQLNAKKSIDYSGTFIPNKPQDMFNVLNRVLPDIFPNRAMFLKMYGLDQVKNDNETKALLRRFLGNILKQTVLIRRYKKLSVKKHRRTIVLPIDNPEIRKQITVEMNQFRKLEEATRQVDKIQLLAALNALRKTTATYKLDVVADKISAQINNFRTPLNFGYHTDIIDSLDEKLRVHGHHGLVIHGKSSAPSKRQIIIDEFQNGHGEYVNAGIKSAGTAVTITRANIVNFIEMDWDPFDMLQAEERAYRTGQICDVDVNYYVYENSVDAYLAYTNNEKIRIALEILDCPGNDDLQKLCELI
jgi:SNF2-related domain